MPYLKTALVLFNDRMVQANCRFCYYTRVLRELQVFGGFLYFNHSQHVFGTHRLIVQSYIQKIKSRESKGVPAFYGAGVLIGFTQKCCKIKAFRFCFL